MAAYQSTYFADLSHELLCHILQYLPLKEVLSMSMLCKKLSVAVDMHLRLRKYIDFCEGQLYGYMSSTITDDHLHSLFKKCPQLQTVYGLHPLKVERRRLRKRSALTVPGIMDALSLCCNLKAVETSDLRLLEALMQNLPKIEIIGHFRNRDGVFPPHASQRLKLQPYPRISSLHLIGVEIPELSAMPRLEYLHLQCVRFTKIQPFRTFFAPNLKTFVMKHCMGPTMALRYLSLIIALSASPSLSRLELVRVPLLGGLFQRAVEDSYRINGFVNLKTLVISGCKGIMEADVGHLMIVASKNLEAIFIQPSLTRDSLFVSLSFAQCEFPMLKSIHLGYVDKLNTPGEWSNDALLSLGLAEVPDTPSSLTDSGMKVISQLFPNIKNMSVSNCPHLMSLDQWSDVDGEEQSWRDLTDLTLQRCHCLKLSTFALFIAFLPKIESVLLNDMFREPPKGCSHVGLSAGTGLGMSSAVVSNQDEHIAVQGHQQDFEAPADEHIENEEVDLDFIEEQLMDHEDQHIMVLQQEFFDDERRIVLPPVRHGEDLDPEAMPQNDQENRIRRELNDDYDVALNIEELMQARDVENRNGVPVEEAERELSLDEDSKHEHVPFVNEEYSGNLCEFICKKSPSHEDPEVVPVIKTEPSDGPVDEALRNSPQLSDKVSKPEVMPYMKHQPSAGTSGYVKRNHKLLSSSDDDDGLYPETADKVNKPLKKDTVRKKKGGTSAKKCNYSRECKKKCSKGFDPNQPSTSRGGNCLDCTCVEEDVLEGRVESSQQNSRDNETSVPIKSEITQSKKRKSSRITRDSAKKHCKSSGPVDNSLANEYNSADEVDNFEDKVFKGPLTRQRKRVLDTDIKEEPSTPIKPSSSAKVSKNNPPSSSACGRSKKLKSSPLEDKNKLPSQCKVASTSNSTDSKSKKKTVDQIDPKVEETEANEKDENKDNPKNKKHRKHKHRRCKKKKCDKLCHRRYPFTRSRRNRFVRDEHNIVSQGTQATSADIRRALRKQRACSTRCRRRTCSGSHRRSHNHISARQQFKRPLRKNNAELHNKSTSTSDPLMEDDAVQILRLVSESLISLTVISCGISDVVIDHCKSLTHIEVQACRILKMFQLHFCPSLKRLNISQCPKLGLEVIIPEVVLSTATRKLLVSFEPCMQIYNPAASEKAIFSRLPLGQSVIVFHDFTSNANESLQAEAKENLLSWMEVVQRMYHTRFFWPCRPLKKHIKTRDSKTKFPYGHHLRRVHGVYTLPASVDPEGTQWRYQILTNDPVFASALEIIPWDNGFPPPESGSTEDDVLLNINEPEFADNMMRMRKKMTTFYIPVSESNMMTD